MIKVIFSKKGLGLASPHFVYDFLMFLMLNHVLYASHVMLYSIDWPNFIVFTSRCWGMCVLQLSVNQGVMS